MNSRTHALLTLTMLIWAGSFIFIKIGLRDLDPYNLAFYRFLMASPLLLFWNLLRGRLNMLRVEDLPQLSVLALSGVSLLYVIQFLALKYTTATNAAILINTSAVFVAVWGFVRGEATLRKIVGVILSFFGVILIISKGTMNFFSSKTFLGDALMIVDGMLWAIYTVLGSSMLSRYDNETLTMHSFLLGTLFLAPFALWSGVANPVNFTSRTIIALLYLAVLCSVFAYVVWYHALSSSDSTSVAVYVYLVPLFTAVFSYFALHEVADIFTVVGGAITILGVYLTVSSSVHQ